ncbi:hypothetical protein [Bosea sp. BK604]|uniref:hypothetical protein n=1 Tax=Bosea sp. BK604 TaxID=2512180 RepID=UPI0010EB5F58|nr:hypothetical protein [Bosea sp. BK604]TCR69669.1 hypothetical protein EV560_10166 [Bosea sp. BK604]
MPSGKAAPMTRPEALRLRRTYPDSDEFWHVIDQEGENIGVIADHRGHTGPDRPGWFWGISVFGLPQPGRFRGHERTREEAMARIREEWPSYRRQYSEEHYERRRSEHRGREVQWRGTR